MTSQDFHRAKSAVLFAITPKLYNWSEKHTNCLPKYAWSLFIGRHALVFYKDGFYNRWQFYYHKL